MQSEKLDNFSEPKSNLPASPEILRVLKPSEAGVPASATSSHARSNPAPDSSSKEITEQPMPENFHDVSSSAVSYNLTNLNFLRIFLRVVLPLLVIFGIGIFVHYYYFSEVSLTSWFQPKAQVANITKDKKLDELYVTEKEKFENWVKLYYFDISDPSILDPKKDLSGNGLTSFQKYILGLNPKVYDTLKQGKADSEYLLAGVNPLTGDLLTESQKQLIEQFIELDIAINSKLSYPADDPVITVSSGALRGELSDTSVSEFQVTSPAQAPTASANSSSAAINPTSSSVNEKSFNKLGIPAVQNYLDIDFSKPGKLEIPSLGITAPINWPTQASENDKALETGVIRVPGTAEPGSVGTSYISGHSSDYAWKPGNYKQIFSKLNNISNKASIYVYVVDKKGNSIKLTYIVTGRGDFFPSDPAQFENTADPTLALGTCWPIGGNAKRKVIFSTLDKIERN